MSDEIQATVQVPENVNVNAQTGQVYNYENSIIVGGVTEQELNAAIATRVAKAGDTMTGDLRMGDGLAVKLDGETDYEIKSPADSKKLTALANGKGVYLDGTNNEQPYYTDGTNNYKLLNSDDITNGTADFLRTWGNLIGTISDQTDLTAYIKSVIGGTGVLGRPDYSNGIAVEVKVNGNGENTYTCPSKGFLSPISWGSSSSGTATWYMNGKEISTPNFSTFNLIPVSQGDILKLKITGASLGKSTGNFNFFAQLDL